MLSGISCCWHEAEFVDLVIEILANGRDIGLTSHILAAIYSLDLLSFTLEGIASSCNFLVWQFEGQNSKNILPNLWVYWVIVLFEYVIDMRVSSDSSEPVNKGLK